MSFQMQIPVLGPRPAPRVWATALSTYFPLVGPGYDPDQYGVQRWLNGVRFFPYGCDLSVGRPFDPCAERMTDYLETGDCVAFDPFIAEVAVQEPTLITSIETLTEYVIAHSEQSRSSHLAAEVERAASSGTNISLSSEASIVSIGADTVQGALAAVEEGLAAILDGGAGMIHVSPGLFSMLSAGGGVRYDADGRAYTVTGHLYVADAGYLGVSPDTGEVVDGEMWIYGSGPVFAKYSPLVSFAQNPQELLDLSRNLLQIDAEQYGIAIFEPCSVVAAMVNIASSSGGSGDVVVDGGAP